MQYITQTNPSPMGSSDVLLSRKVRKSISKEEAFELIRSRTSQGDQGRDPVHLTLQKQWFTNVASYIGINGFEAQEQLLDIAPGLLPRDTGFNSNLIFRFVMYQVSLLTSGEPALSVTPKSPDPDDQFGSRVAEWFLAHYDDVYDFSSIRDDLAFWMVTCGNGFCKVDWDVHAGKLLEQYSNPFDGSPQDEQFLTDDQKRYAKANGGYKSRKSGRLDIDVLSPFQVIPPRGFTNLDDMPWICLEYERSYQWVWDRYPSEAKKLSPDDFDTSADGQYWRRLSTLAHSHGISLPSQGAEGNETVRISEIWVPPSEQFPRGIWARATRNTLLDRGPHPFHEENLRKKDWLRLPIVHFGYGRAPGRFWYTGLVEHLIGPQRDYNRARHQSILQRDMMGQPQFMMPSGTKLSTTNNDVGTFIEYRNQIGYGKPELIPAPSPSSMHIETMDRAIADMRIISAQGEAVQGDVPTGMRSGAALRNLQEKDGMTIAPTIKRLERSWQKVCRKILSITHEFMDVPEAINAYGETRAGDVQVFSGSDLYGNVEVRIRPGSMMPKSRAESMQTMMELVQLGVVNPADGDQLEMIFNAIEVEGASSLFDGVNADKRRAEHENYMFMKPKVDEVTGQPQGFPPVMDYDDHQAHLKKHIEFMKTDAYEALPEIRKLAFEAHVQQHEEAILLAAQALMTAQGAPGAQPGPGGGSPPAEKGQPSPPARRNQAPGSESPA